MIYRVYFFALAVICLCIDKQVQALDLNYAIIHSGLTTYSHTSTPQSKPAFLEFKLASVCFLGTDSCSEDVKYNFANDDLALDTGNKCKQEGYDKTECVLPAYLSDVCPYNDKYFAKCETDKVRACEEGGFVASCGDGEILDSLQTCPYDSSFKKCKCNPCSGYDYTSAQATAQGYVTDGSCQSCAVVKYKRKENPCVGYSSCECGGDLGAKICYTGSVQKYNKCKTCCENRCSLTVCPANHSCDYESCSNKYCDLGCAGGYTDMCLVNGSCVAWGYSQQSCVGDILYCPYDTTYKFCLSL